jgi:16S rRNA (guanine1516-N2)-methyltransferase
VKKKMSEAIKNLVKIAVMPEMPELLGRAEGVASNLRLPIFNGDLSLAQETFSFLILISKEGTKLQKLGKPKVRPVMIDFLSQKNIFRKNQGGGKKQLIARAVGLNKKNDLKILDVNAGLGSDAFVLASLGAKVLMLERSPIISLLLEDALQRAENFLKTEKINLELTKQDALCYLKEKSFSAMRPDVIFLDPMYPERKKSAIGSKEMRILKEIVGEDLDAPRVLSLALNVALMRVVVKRPKLALWLGDKKPDLIFFGKSTRFDVYLVKGQK